MSSYVKSDLISINGVSENSNVVNLSILNSNNELVWAEQVSVKSDGRYSTLAMLMDRDGKILVHIISKLKMELIVNQQNFHLIHNLSNSFQCESISSLNPSTLISSIYSR